MNKLAILFAIVMSLTLSTSVFAVTSNFYPTVTSNYYSTANYTSPNNGSTFTPQLGDMNCDGKVNAADALNALQFLIATDKWKYSLANALVCYKNTGDFDFYGYYGNPIDYIALGDLDHDGVLTRLDVLNILRKAGKLGLLPNKTTGKPVTVGDVDGSGPSLNMRAVTSGDANKVLIYALTCPTNASKQSFLNSKNIRYSVQEFEAIADTDGDGVITATDALNVLKIAVKQAYY